jgi:hypothetical protein
MKFVIKKTLSASLQYSNENKDMPLTFSDIYYGEYSVSDRKYSLLVTYEIDILISSWSENRSRNPFSKSRL